MSPLKEIIIPKVNGEKVCYLTISGIPFMTLTELQAKSLFRQLGRILPEEKKKARSK